LNTRFTGSPAAWVVAAATLAWVAITYTASESTATLWYPEVVYGTSWIAHAIYWVTVAMIPFALLCLAVSFVNGVEPTAWTIVGFTALAWVGERMAASMARSAEYLQFGGWPNTWVLSYNTWELFEVIYSLVLVIALVNGTFILIIVTARGAYRCIRQSRQLRKLWAESVQNGCNFRLGAQAFARRLQRKS